MSETRDYLAAVGELRARQEALRVGLIVWQTRLLELERQVQASWDSYDALQLGAKALAADALALGEQASVTLTLEADMKRVQRGVSVLRWAPQWRWGVKP